MPGSFEDLEVWKFAMELVFDVYEVTCSFPQDERFGLVSQMRRAAVSIPSNMAEGKGRTSDKDCANFLGHARGSQHELYTQILIARHLGLISVADCDSICERLKRIGRMLHGLIKSMSAEAAGSPV